MPNFTLVAAIPEAKTIRWFQQDPMLPAICPIEHNFSCQTKSPRPADDAHWSLIRYAERISAVLDPGEHYYITYRPWEVTDVTRQPDGQIVRTLTTRVSDLRTALVGLTLTAQNPISVTAP